MRMFNNYAYWGNKGGAYLEELFQLLPKSKMQHIVETCMGSGTFSSNISGEYGDIKATAIEKDRGVYLLNKCIKERPIELFEKLKEIQYTKEFYDDSHKKIIDCLNGSEKYEELEIAQAEYAILMMSFNAMRNSYRSLESYMKISDSKEQERRRKVLERMKNNCFRNMGEIIMGNNFAWKNLDIIHGDFMEYSEFWTEGKETLVFADVPYELSKRNATKKKKGTGYMVDWNENDQNKFLEFVEQMQVNDNTSRIIICANFEVDENGELKGLKEDTYNKKLLALGFRLVVVLEKFTSEIKHKNSKLKEKKKKVEVVYMNYTDIIGEWNKLKYYDYNDVYGNVVA